MRYAALLLGFFLAACAASRAPAPPDSTEALVAAMHARYDGVWYPTLVFTQDTYLLQPDSSVQEQVWREWLHAPGRLRIEVGDPDQLNGTLFARDSTYAIRGGQVAVRRAGRNDLLTLGFDVYHQPPAVTLAQLRADGFALTPVREDTWEGRPAYVFGTPETKEVWIDRERLVFVRLVKPGPNGGPAQDIRFTDYAPVGEAWIAPTVEVWAGGRKVFWEHYRDVQTGISLDPSLFDPDAWAEARHP